MEYSLFENFEYEKTAQDKANRVALSVAQKRVDDNFGYYLSRAENRQEFASRLEVAEPEIRHAIHAACDEYGGEHELIHRHVMAGLQRTAADRFSFFDGSGGDEESSSESDGETYGRCPKCGNPDSYNRGKCSDCGYQKKSSRTASTKLARRPKLCPYHSEVMDISLASGDPQAGFNAMSQHAWGPKHCQGEFDGSCNFKREMVTQDYWDKHSEQLNERREQREQERAFEPQPAEEELFDGDMTPDEPTLDDALEDAPSAVAEVPADAESSMALAALAKLVNPTRQHTGAGRQVHVTMPDNPEGTSYEAYDDNPGLTQAVQRRFDGGGDLVRHPTDPNTLIHGPHNFWDGPRHLKFHPEYEGMLANRNFYDPNAPDELIGATDEYPQGWEGDYYGPSGYRTNGTNGEFRPYSQHTAAPYSEEDKANAAGQPPIGQLPNQDLQHYPVVGNPETGMLMNPADYSQLHADNQQFQQGEAERRQNLHGLWNQQQQYDRFQQQFPSAMEGVDRPTVFNSSTHTGAGANPPAGSSTLHREPIAPDFKAEPTMDKRKWTPENIKPQKAPEGTDDPDGPHATENQDIISPAEYKDDPFTSKPPEHALSPVMERQDINDYSDVETQKNIDEPDKSQWTTTDGFASPVTRDALSSHQAGIFGDIVKGVGNLGGDVLNLPGDALHGVGDVAKGVLNAPGDIAQNLGAPQGITDAMKAPGNAVGDVADVAGNLSNLPGNMMKDVGNAAAGPASLQNLDPMQGVTNPMTGQGFDPLQNSFPSGYANGAGQGMDPNMQQFLQGNPNLAPTSSTNPVSKVIESGYDGFSPSQVVEDAIKAYNQ